MGVFLRRSAGVSRKDKVKNERISNGRKGGSRYRRYRKEIVKREQAYAENNR
jgi:hypothetical protein